MKRLLTIACWLALAGNLFAQGGVIGGSGRIGGGGVMGAAAGGGGSLTLVGVDAGTDQSGSNLTSVATAGIATTTGWGALVMTRAGNTAQTISAPTMTSGNTCTLVAGSKDGTTSADETTEIAYCASITGNAHNVVTCNFTSTAYDSCVVLYFTGITTGNDTSSCLVDCSGTSPTGQMVSGPFTTTHATELLMWCATYGNNTSIFSAGAMGSASGILGETSGNNTAGTNNDTGCEYAFVTTIQTTQTATINIAPDSSGKAGSFVSMY